MNAGGIELTRAQCDMLIEHVENMRAIEDGDPHQTVVRSLLIEQLLRKTIDRHFTILTEMGRAVVRDVMAAVAEDLAKGDVL